MFTPHARGSTIPAKTKKKQNIVYPACAGIDPPLKKEMFPDFSLPRMRGDRPPPLFLLTRATAFTPHARGSTLLPPPHPRHLPVYPACAGIDLMQSDGGDSLRCLPRMRGDRPLLISSYKSYTTFTPHARGSTEGDADDPCYTLVYPACAGIDRCPNLASTTCIGLPRMRGDRPPVHGLLRRSLLFTPHARGSTLQKRLALYCKTVYPACAGIDLVPSVVIFCQVRLPRMRGDRPRFLPLVP